ncbi:MAG: hypothetical protein KY455_00770 [Euryarchaeota archaeon]|nr:hypothetical protein [Euryarchaeota archaeon]
MRPAIALLVLGVLLLQGLPAASAHEGHTHATGRDLIVGVDRREDVRPLVEDELPGPTVHPSGADIRLLEFNKTDDRLNVRLHVDGLPEPPAAVVYRVAFDIADKTYHVCWDPHGATVQKNRVGVDGVRGLCDRIADGATRIGPSTTEGVAGDPSLSGGRAGVRTEEGRLGDGHIMIAWDIAPDELHTKALPRIVSHIRAETWSLGTPPSSAWAHVSKAPYVLLDRAPDRGVWNADLEQLSIPPPVPGIPFFQVAAVGDDGPKKVADHDDNVTYAMRVETTDIRPGWPGRNYTMRLFGVPDNATVTISPERFELRDNKTSQAVQVRIAVGDTPYGAYPLRLITCDDAVDAPEHPDQPVPPNGCVFRELELMLSPYAHPGDKPVIVGYPDERPPMPEEARSLPAPGLPLLLLGLLAGLALVRMRRPDGPEAASTLVRPGTLK